MAKKIVLCFDGTWNDPDTGTNVFRIFESIDGFDVREKVAPADAKVVKWYDAGVGSKWGTKLLGALFGVGLRKNLKQGYSALVENYELGDEIYIFGFSRGAYTARSLAGFIRNISILKKENVNRVNEGFNIYKRRNEVADSDRAMNFRTAYSWDREQIEIKFLGVWDTVGALGIPRNAFTNTLGFIGKLRNHGFHDTRLSGMIKNAFHGVSIDENRRDYEATLWTSEPKADQTITQVWFAGAHSQVGGGAASRNLSDATLNWMQLKAQDLDLPFLENKIAPVNPNDYESGSVSNSYYDSNLFKRYYRIMGIGENIRKMGIEAVDRQTGAVAVNQYVHPLVVHKIGANNGYSPKNEGFSSVERGE